jgi:hypothetical protein
MAFASPLFALPNFALPNMTRLFPLLLALLLVTPFARAASTADDHGDSAAALRDRHARLASQIENSPFQRPVLLASSESGSQLQGSVDAVVAQPFALARDNLPRPEALCEILMLQINTKQCVVAGRELVVHIGRKHTQPVEDAYRVAFTVQPGAATDEHMSVQLAAETGPFSTRDYRIRLQAIPLDGGQRTFLHLSYSYGIGLPARLAMQGYLATAGASKVGFTRTSGDGYIGGMRGAVERNTMRYYLAIDAYLASLTAAPAQQRMKRLEAWFAATEQYARQLHEIERSEYLAMKQAEFRRLRA